MLNLTFEAVDGFEFWPSESESVSWLRNSHVLLRFAQAMRLIKRERDYRAAPFDADIFNTLNGRVHFRIHPTDWQLSSSMRVAGLYVLSGGPYDPAIDGGGFCDLIEISWTHETEMAWDTIEHEFGHMIQYRMPDESVDFATFHQNWQYMGHGDIVKDPYIRYCNGQILDGYPITQPYFPGLTGRPASSSMFADGDRVEVVHRCGVVF